MDDTRLRDALDALELLAALVVAPTNPEPSAEHRRLFERLEAAIRTLFGAGAVSTVHRAWLSHCGRLMADQALLVGDVTARLTLELGSRAVLEQLAEVDAERARNLDRRPYRMTGSQLRSVPTSPTAGRPLPRV